MACLKFYLCQTEVGPQLVHLQADAKKIDRNFETVEIDTAKIPLMERLNELMRRAPAPVVNEEEPVAVSRPVPPSTKPSAAASSSQRGYDQIGFEEFIWAIPDSEVRRLDVFEEVIQERRAEIGRAPKVKGEK